MPNYNPSTIARIADIESGIRVDTGSIAAATYLRNGTQVELFNVYGRIKVINLFLEVITALSNNAYTAKFNATFTTPSIAVADMSAACASTAQLAAGRRITWLGGAVATAAIVTQSAGISLLGATPQVIGGIGFVGTIGILGAAANHDSGACIATIFYVPWSDGAYVTAAL